MSTITLRLVKGSPLTNAEVDANFSNLNTDKYQAGDSPDFVDILTDKLSLDTAATPGVLTAGEMAWNVDEGTADLGLNGGDVILQIGQETHYRVVNKTGSTITNGALCMYDGTIGASGQIRVKPWIGGSDPLLIMGIATADILNDARGYVTTFGKIRKINTSGTPYGETWLDGDILYAGPSGGLTKVRPAAPNTKSVIAAVVKAHATVGELLVRVTLSSSIENDDEVELTSITDKDVLQWNATNSRFENKSFAAAGLQPTLVSGTNIKTVNGNSLVGSGDVSLGTVTSVATNNGITGGTITTTGTIGLTGQALALHNLATNGIIARTGAGTVAGRTVTAGTGISVSNGDGVSGNPTITNTAPDQTVALSAGTGISTSGTYPNFTVTNTGVTSVAGTANQVTVSASTGAVTFSLPTTINVNTSGTAANVTGTVAVANGGTGATSAATALSNLGAYAASNPSGYVDTAGARSALSFAAGSGAYNSSTGVITIPTNTNQLTNGAGFTTNTGTVTSVAVSGTNITVSGSPITTSGTISVSIPQAVATSSSVQFGSFGVGTAASGTTGEIRATNNITAYFSSDRKFKENIAPIGNALGIVSKIGGKTFDWTDAYIAEHGGADGYFVQKSDFGVIAQDVHAVFPQAVRTREDGSLAVDYAKLSALAFAAIVELKAEIDALKGK